VREIRITGIVMRLELSNRKKLPPSAVELKYDENGQFGMPGADGLPLTSSPDPGRIARLDVTPVVAKSNARWRGNYIYTTRRRDKCTRG
jgi:hypothetical protein